MGDFRSDVSEGGDARSVASWQVDAMKQGGGDIADLMGSGRGGGSPSDAQQGGDSDHTNIDDEQVLEQYRIVAHFEATRRVRENTDFDIDEYNRTRKSYSEPIRNRRREYLKNAKPILPDMKSAASSSSRRSNMREPDMPDPRLCQLFPPKNTQYPDVAVGNKIEEDAAPLTHDEISVECMGCSARLRFSTLALMVKCPACSNVTPATLTAIQSSTHQQQEEQEQAALAAYTC
jgi:hypothetical protein